MKERFICERDPIWKEVLRNAADFEMNSSKRFTYILIFENPSKVKQGLTLWNKSRLQKFYVFAFVTQVLLATKFIIPRKK